MVGEIEARVGRVVVRVAAFVEALFEVAAFVGAAGDFALLGESWRVEPWLLLVPDVVGSDEGAVAVGFEFRHLAEQHAFEAAERAGWRGGDRLVLAEPHVFKQLGGDGEGHDAVVVGGAVHFAVAFTDEAAQFDVGFAVEQVQFAVAQRFVEFVDGQRFGDRGGAPAEHFGGLGVSRCG